MALKKIALISASALVALLMASSASAHDGDNVATGHKDGKLVDQWGNCIISKSGNDLCSPPPPPPVKCKIVKSCHTVPTKVTVSKNLAGDTNFKFDKSNLTAAGRAELEGFVNSLRGINISNVNVAGHTDAVGSASYNLKLSKKRAATVANFLVGHGVPGSKITAAGYGESQATLPASASNAARMVDRRVDITVKGTTTGAGKGRQVCTSRKVCPAAK